jgi:hypothetical protein
VIGLGVVGAHGRGVLIAIAAWADATADDDWRVVIAISGAQFGHQADGVAVDGVERVGGETEAGAPVGIGAPRGALEDEASAVGGGDVEIALIVRAQQISAAGIVEQQERGEVWQLEAIVKDERGLEAAVGEIEATGQLGQGAGSHGFGLLGGWTGVGARR